jgi:hypothetical protein
MASPGHNSTAWGSRTDRHRLLLTTKPGRHDADRPPPNKTGPPRANPESAAEAGQTGVILMTNRAEHLQWCKDRALAYADEGDAANALASMASDLRKHPETAEHGGVALGTMLAMGGHLSSPRDIREWIEGFN